MSDHFPDLDAVRLPKSDPRRYFNSSWYRETFLGELESSVDPWDHYVLVGERSGAMPHPMFSPTYYRAQAQDHGGLALEHYARFGIDRMIHPHPLVRPSLPGQDLHWFAENDDPGIGHLIRSAAESSQTSRLLRYLLSDDKAERFPNPLFDRQWYREQFGPEIGPFGDPLAHYLAVGGHRGLPTGRDIDWKPFLSRRQDLLLQALTPMEHVLLHEPGGSFTFGSIRPEAAISRALADHDVPHALMLLAAWHLTSFGDWTAVTLHESRRFPGATVRELSGALLVENESTGYLLGTPRCMSDSSTWWVTEDAVLTRKPNSPIPDIPSCVLLDPSRTNDVQMIRTAIRIASTRGVPVLSVNNVGEGLRVLAEQCGVSIAVLTPASGVAVREIVRVETPTGDSLTQEAVTVRVTARTREYSPHPEDHDPLTADGCHFLLALLPPGSDLQVSNSGQFSPSERRSLTATAEYCGVRLIFEGRRS